jgi:hypothetical protein
MKSCLALAIALMLLPACGGAADAQGLVDEAQAALTARDYDQAAVLAEKAALAAGTEGNVNLKWRATGIKISALGRGGKGMEAASALEAAAMEFSDKVDARFYAKTIGEVQTGGDIEGALAVLEAGSKRFPDKKAEFDGAAQKLKTAGAGDPEVLERLKALGYL